MYRWPGDFARFDLSGKFQLSIGGAATVAKYAPVSLPANAHALLQMRVVFQDRGAVKALVRSESCDPL
jgi:hypothetical protein